MNHRKMIAASFVAMLGASVVQNANAWGTGGSSGTPLKAAFADLALFCNLSHPDSTATIETSPSAGDDTARPSFKFSGQMVCAEIPNAAGTPQSLSSAITLASGGKAIGLFNLIQVTDPSFFPGLTYSKEEPGDGSIIRKWTFDVTGHANAFPYAQALWKLVPADATAQRFCDPAELGVSGVPPILDSGNCQALFGLKTALPLIVGDYGGILDLADGQIFTFKTVTKNNIERAAGFTWAPCHTTRFIGPVTPDVVALANSSNIVSGLVTGTTPKLVANPTTTGGNRTQLHVAVQPNDLWNAGPLPRWSNAKGLISDLSIASFRAYGGFDYLDQLDPQVKAWFGGSITNPASATYGDKIGQSFGAGPSGDGFVAPFGSLVGWSALNGGYKLLGTSGVISVAEGEQLKLFYWDTTTGDNTGSVKVTVATDSIQCSVGGTEIATQGQLAGNSPVNVVYNPDLNVKNNSGNANFPATIVGCTTYSPSFTIGTDGSPIISSDTEAKINGTPVNYTGYHVADTISDNSPSCLDGGAALGYGLLDLRVDIQRASVIDAIAPGGYCTNGVHSYKLEIGSNTNGWFAGTGTVTLSNCKSPL